MPDRPPEGLAYMRSLAGQFPRQLREGFAAARELERPIPRSARHLFLAGMGGSAIAADLVRSITDPELEIGFEVGRAPTLPRSIDSTAVTLLASYSGGTWETLQAYDEAGRRNSPRIVLSSGGEIARRAERDGVPHLLLPPGLPPRQAVGFVLGGLLGLLDPFFKESNEDRLGRAVDRVELLQATYTAPKGPAAKLARAVGSRTPQFYADVSVAALARRWKTQVEENAKRLAHFDQFPELFHNAIVGWDALPPADARQWAVVMLEWGGQSKSITPGLRYFDNLLKRRRVVSARVVFDADDPLDALLSGVSFGDHFTLFLAEAAGVDPYPIHAITRLKRAVENA
jgi:glucose/mannose-6-phosphate isomerase